MAKKKKALRAALITAGVATGIGAFVYEYTLPEQSAEAYLNDIRSNARQTKKTFKNLAKTIDNLDTITTTTDTATRQTSLKEAQQRIAEANAATAVMKEASARLKTYPFSGYIGSYVDARIAQRHAEDFASRSSVALTAYGTMLVQADTYATTLTGAQTVFAQFNSVANINDYAGQSDLMRQYASTLRQAASTLTTIELPSAYSESRASSIVALEQGAVGFDHLAAALDYPIDDIIYSAVREIETASVALETANQAALNDKLASSRTIKDIDDLVETIDYLE